MGLLTKEQVDEVWDEGGMKHNVHRLYKFLRAHGLLPMSVPLYNFQAAIKKRLLIDFFVKGKIEDEQGHETYPSESD
jgi:hypothetical protein